MHSRTLPFLCAGLAMLLAWSAPVKAQPPQDEKARKALLLTSELFIAIRDGDTRGVDSALARGANPNGRNWLNFTPLMWAASRGNKPIVDRLLAHHADINGASVYGAPISFAIEGRHEALALYLLDRGETIRSERTDSATPLMLAAGNGQKAVIQRLLAKKADPNAKDIDSATPLMYAARNGYAEVMPILIQAGARVNAWDSHGRTALMYASENGRIACVDLLLAHEAQVNLQDKSGATALTLAARYSGSTTVIGRLLRAGANREVRDGAGVSALNLAEMRGFDEAAAALRKPGASRSQPVTVAMTTAQITPAVDRSLAVVQKSLKAFAGRAQCISCHHQGVGMMALGTAQQHGFTVDKELQGSYLKQIGEDGQKSGPFIHVALHDADVAKTIPALDIGDISIGAGYIFGGLIANGVPSNPGLQEMAQFLVQQQAPDGHWGYGMDREPIQSSYVTTTALVLQIMRSYGSNESADSMERAKRWLLTVPTPNTEDKASRLLGLKWAGASKEECAKSVEALLAAQRPDGGWAQLTSTGSDAYASGMALYALHVGGELPTNAPSYQKGIQFLLRTQDEDGSWYVSKRANPANTYFDAGFPHGESQYISFAATCWATMALVQVNEASVSASR